MKVSLACAVVEIALKELEFLFIFLQTQVRAKESVGSAIRLCITMKTEKCFCIHTVVAFLGLRDNRQ